MKIVYQNVVWLLIFVAYNYLCLAEDDRGKEENNSSKYRYPTEITVGAFFHEENSQAKVAFDSAMYTANVMRLRNMYNPVDEIISESDSFKASKTVCNLIKEGVGGIFGPVSNKTSAIVESICLNLEIPYIQTSWRSSASGNQYINESTYINFFPKADVLARGIGIIAKHLQWRSFIVLYEDSDSLIRLQEVLKLQSFNPNNRYNTMLVKRLGPGPDYKPVLKEVLKTTEHRFILDCKAENLFKILKQAQEIKLLEPFHAYFLTSLDAHTVDLEALKTRANITTIRIVDYSSNLDKALRNWRQYAEINNQGDIDLGDFSVTTETALMHDAVHLFIKTLVAVDTTNPVSPQGLSCSDKKEKWTDGLGIISFMKQLDYVPSGITGPIRFDSFGNRINFTLYIVEGNQRDILATWNPQDKREDEDNIVFVKSESDRNRDLIRKLTEGDIIVSSRLGAPYLMEKKKVEGQILQGNDRYEGFSLDLMYALAEHLNFTFRIELAADGKYGNYDAKNKSWNGLIKDILDRKATLAICDLTITHERRDVVDFSTPFMRLGISILYKKQDEKDVDMFAFLDPFSVDVWIYSATLYLTITVVIYFIARGSSADWENPHPCEQNPEELENIWTLKNCLWLTMGAIMNQGCDILPKGISTRMAAAMWWFFAIIVTNSYMANLAAFLTMERMEPSIDNAEDLAKQSKIKYGTLKDGSTAAFFRNSNYSVYQRMWTAMVQAKPTVFENTNDDGVNRVKNTRNRLYAFLMESTTLEYQTQTNCDLYQVGGLLDNKGYGIAMPLDYPFRSKINKAILHLQEIGVINQLKTKWWEEMRDQSKRCPKDTGETDSNKLALKNVGGVFLVLGVGIALAYIVAIMEFLWNVKNVAVEEHMTYWQALKVELKFAMMVWVTEKRTKPQISESSSTHSSQRSGIAQSILQGAGSFLHLNVINKSRSPSRQSN